MSFVSDSTPKFDFLTLAQKFAMLDTFQLILVGCIIAAAIYFSVECFVSDYSAGEVAFTTGRVVSENSRLGDDWKHFTVEFQSESGSMHTIPKVAHPLRRLDIGENVSVRYPLAAPEKGNVYFSPVTSALVVIVKVGAMLFLAYTILINA